MNNHIRNMQAQLSQLDTYSQLSVLGSWNFMVNSAAINQAMRLVPDVDDHSGIDGYTPYEQARRVAIKEAETSQLPALLGLQREITGWIQDCDGDGRDLNDTLKYLSSNIPLRATFENEYENRRRSGLKPGMSKKTFVDYEHERAMNQHNALVAKGEDAVRICETLTFDDSLMSSTNIPDWISESFEAKMLEKLHSRWEKLDFIRSNPRRRKQIRDAAAADQLMIARLLSEYGEEPGFDDAAEDFDDSVEDIK
jgi:hypothetical protein